MEITSDILLNVSNDGCDEFVHHLLIVAGSLPNWLANHLAVLLCSTKTTFNLFNSLFFIVDLTLGYKSTKKNEILAIISVGIASFH